MTLADLRVLLVVAPGALCVAELFATKPVSLQSIAAAILVALGGLCLVGRNRAPLAAPLLCLGLTAMAVGLPLGIDDLVTPQYVLFAPAFLIAVHVDRNRALGGLAACIAGISALNAATAQSASSWVFGAGALTGSFVVGAAIRRQRALEARLAAVAARIAAERDELSRLAVQDVRSRISEDVNTLVARSVGSMVVASEAAVRLLDADDAAAAAAMESIEEIGREALAEMRRVLGAIRKDEVAAA